MARRIQLIGKTRKRLETKDNRMSLIFAFGLEMEINAIYYAFVGGRIWSNIFSCNKTNLCKPENVFFSLYLQHAEQFQK